MEDWMLNDLVEGDGDTTTGLIPKGVLKGNVIHVRPELEPIMVAIKLHNDFESFCESIQSSLRKFQIPYLERLSKLDMAIASSRRSPKEKEEALVDVILFRQKIINNLRRMFGFLDSEIISGKLIPEFYCDERISLWRSIEFCVPDKHIIDFEVAKITECLINSLPEEILNIYEINDY